jgi:hypothetical protein
MSAALRLALSCLVLTACGPSAIGGSPGALVGLLMVLGLGLLFVPGRRDLRASSPDEECSGQETHYCAHGRIRERCCPAGAKCNYRDEPFVECGRGYCTTSGDVGRCPVPTPLQYNAHDEATCHAMKGHWELACAERVVVAACLPPVPTNFSDPSPNPSFHVCGRGTRLVSGDVAEGERCSTHPLEDDCYPSQAELGMAPCPGAWTPMCIGGAVVDRCVPVVPLAPRTWTAATFVSCPDGSCAVGSDGDACSAR